MSVQQQNPSPYPSSSGEISKDIKGRKKLKRTLVRPASLMGVCPREGKLKSCRLNRQGYGHDKAKSSVVLQAEELQSKLDPKYPSFIKCLVRSHVTGCFWMGLPVPFCQKHLPQQDTLMTLEIQNEKAYKAKYLVRKTGLSGGWRRFVIAEKLLVGDVLVFHLISATKFKVYAIRGKDLTEVDGAIFLLNLDTHAERNHLNMRTGTVEHYRRAQQTSSPPPTARDQDEGIRCPESDHRTMQPPENTESSLRTSSNVQPPEAVVCSSSSITSLEKFNILIDELLKDFELPGHIKWSYYKLCCTQNTFLHAHLPKETNHVLIAGMIIETVSIADALRNCELSTFCNEFAVWDKTFGSFEQLGMNVGFLREHLHRLQRIAYDPEIAMYRQKCSELCSENARAGDEIRSLEARLSEMKKSYDLQAANIENLQEKIENHELKFQEQASAPW